MLRALVVAHDFFQPQGVLHYRDRPAVESPKVQQTQEASMNLEDVLAAKGPRVVTVPAKSSVADAIRTMHAQKVGAVLVPDAEGCPVGIFTERDVIALYADGDRDFDALAVEARMTCSVVLGRLSMPVDEALGLMTERRFRHLPVVEQGRLLGLVSIGDLVKIKLEEAAQEAQALRAYISS
jgi:CBS domain-containing protein